MPDIFRYADGARRTVALSVVVVVLAATLAQAYASLPPWGQAAVTVEIPSGSSVRDIGEILAAAGAVRSRSAFAVAVALAGAESSLDAGTYIFERAESLPSVVRRLREGDTRATVLVTLPEGLSRKEMSAILVAALPRFSAAGFLQSTEGEEGYLFPDTYHLDPSATAEAVAEQLRGNFRHKLEALRLDVAASGRSLAEIVTMASIVEREATAESRAIVAGILWRRLDDGMALQVDAPFVFAIGKSTRELTKEDLARDGPFNTYTRTGLPPSPIGNPGLAALDATLHPEVDGYRYFLSGRDGEMHFAKTFAEHQVNREKYL
ncbi:MAG TPA: endolytic transglycosylase MltG [Candidatus Paceibacterota bacterium]